MPFSLSERTLLLAVKGVSPTVMPRLEEQPAGQSSNQRGCCSGCGGYCQTPTKPQQ